jgi:hypothetical protein
MEAVVLASSGLELASKLVNEAFPKAIGKTTNTFSLYTKD